MPVEAALGERLRSWRVAHRLSQEDLARSLGFVGLNWNRSMLAKLERGERTLTLTQAIQLALAIRVPLADLLPTEGVVALSQTGGRPITEGVSVDARTVQELLTGRAPDDRRLVHPAIVIEIGEHAVSVITDLEHRTAKTLSAAIGRDVSPGQVAATALRLWDRSLAEERDARARGEERAPGQERSLTDRPVADDQGAQVPAENRTLGALRGHVTRALHDELRAAIEAEPQKRKRNPKEKS